MLNFLAVLLFVLSFVLILKGGEFLVDSAICISDRAKIPPMIVGATVVSVATTLPETCVSLLAVFKGNMILASGNAMGSMICNFALILGIAFTALPSRVDRKGFWLKCIFLVINLVLLIIFATNGSFSVSEGVVLLVLLGLFLIANILEARKNTSPEMAQFFKPQEEKPMWEIILTFVVGAISIAYGSHVLVTNSQIIGSLFKINQKVMALTIVAIGTGLPEIVTTITSIKQKNAGIGVGNMIGANIMNGCMLMGLCSVLSKGKLSLGSTGIATFITLISVYLIAIVPTCLRGKSSRVQGISLLLVYAGYVLYLFLA